MSSSKLIFPVDKCYAALRDGAVDFVGGSGIRRSRHFRFQWRKADLRAGAGHVLVSRSCMPISRRNVATFRWSKASASARRRGWIWACARLLVAAGIDLERDGVNIAPVPGAVGAGINFGLTAAKALEERKIDGFWANGMGAEVALRRGVGTMVLDIRRGDGPKACFNYTAATIATSDALIARAPDTVAAAVRAVVKTQAALKADVTQAKIVGDKLFPPSEAELITDLIRRDLPYYDATLSRDFVAGMSAFARSQNILDHDLAYEDAVAAQFSSLWKA